MDIVIEVGHWLAGANIFPERTEQYTRLLTNIGDIVDVGLTEAYGPAARLAGPPNVIPRPLDESLEPTRDFRITLRPPLIGNSEEKRRLYITALMDYVAVALGEIFRGQEVVELRVEPVLACSVVIRSGRPDPATELGTFRLLGEDN